jgi:nucleoid-associated protein YgaU
MGIRSYSGFDGNAAGKRAGTERFIRLVHELSGGGLWNNGSWGPRLMRGKSLPSIHGTGRAVDLSWRGGDHGGYGSYAEADRWVNFFVRHAAELEIELVIDYFPEPYGTGFKCDRDRRVKYTQHTVDGAPGGDWIHVEVSPRVADDARFFDTVLPALYSGGDVAMGSIEIMEELVLEMPGPEDYPGHPIGVGHHREHEVRAIQARVGVGVDGDYGSDTTRGVQGFQQARGLAVTGTVDQQTWNAMFGVEPSDNTTTVQVDESWWTIAERTLGGGSRWRELAGLNGGEARVLHPGDVVMLPTSPAPSGGTVEVRQGEGWWQIAEQALGEGARWVELAALNGGESRVLHPGDVLHLP